MRWWVERDGTRVEVAVRRIGDRFEVTLGERTHLVDLVPVSPGLASLLFEDGRSIALASQPTGRQAWRLSLGDRDFEVRLRDPLERAVAERGAGAGGPQEIRAPIPGKVVTIAVAAGDRVAVGQPLLVLEAMKMQNQICAEGDGEVLSVLVAPGATVEGGQALIVLG